MKARAMLLRWGRGVLCLGIVGCSAAVFAEAPPACRIAFDVGSSGIRAGASNSVAIARADVDYLSALWEKRSLLQTLPATSDALLDLPAQAGFSAECVRVAGGFSAWRLALHYDAEALIGDLAWLRDASSVPLVVIPQQVEGQYGFRGARALLGERLRTTHILDVGGGSLQVAGEKATFGAMLGQKVWHREMCSLLGLDTSLPCLLQPLSPDDLESARKLARQRLRGMDEALPDGATLTAISRPITQGVFSALQKLGRVAEGEMAIPLAALSGSIDQLAAMPREPMAESLGMPPRFAAYLLSDMILLEAIVGATGGSDVQVAEADLTNVPGLLADEAAFAWAEHYDCYLERLRRQGIDAYFSDQATCGEMPPMPTAHE